MRTMGLLRLYLVSPRCFPHPQADARAAGALEVLKNAQVVDSLQDAVADCSLVFGASARQRRIAGEVVTPRECALQAAAAGQGEVALVFGREDRGLSNEEIQLCSYCLSIPAEESYSSLNLAMAVQIVAYEMRLAALAGEPVQEREQAPPATAREMDHFYRHLEETLEEIGFLDRRAPRQMLPRLRRLFTRARLERMEASMLRGILSAVQRRSTGHHEK